jgi:hypothetical protein
MKSARNRTKVEGRNDIIPRILWLSHLAVNHFYDSGNALRLLLVRSRLFSDNRPFFSITNDILGHAAEDEEVEGEDGVPVEAAEEAFWAEGGGLFKEVLPVHFG